jgi:hypothetical protein
MGQLHSYTFQKQNPESHFRFKFCYNSDKATAYIGKAFKSFLSIDTKLVSSIMAKAINSQS